VVAVGKKRRERFERDLLVLHGGAPRLWNG